MREKVRVKLASSEGKKCNYSEGSETFLEDSKNIQESESWGSRSERHIKQEKKDIMATLTESDKVLSGSHDIIEVHLDSAQSPFVRVTSGATQEN